MNLLINHLLINNKYENLANSGISVATNFCLVTEKSLMTTFISFGVYFLNDISNLLFQNLKI